MARKPRPAAMPDGLGPRHDTARGNGTSIAALVVLVALVGWGLSGRAGNHEQRDVQRTADAVLEVASPGWIRAGEIYEQRLRITALKPIAKLGLAVTPQVWREITVTAILPQPDAQAQHGELWRLEWKQLDAGTTFELKISAQVNPSLWGRNAGRMAVLDGDRELASLPVAMNVLP